MKYARPKQELRWWITAENALNPNATMQFYFFGGKFQAVREGEVEYYYTEKSAQAAYEKAAKTEAVRKGGLKNLKMAKELYSVVQH